MNTYQARLEAMNLALKATAELPSQIRKERMVEYAAAFEGYLAKGAEGDTDTATHGRPVDVVVGEFTMEASLEVTAGGFCKLTVPLDTVLLEMAKRGLSSDDIEFFRMDVMAKGYRQA